MIEPPLPRKYKTGGASAFWLHPLLSSHPLPSLLATPPFPFFPPPLPLSPSPLSSLSPFHLVSSREPTPYLFPLRKHFLDQEPATYSIPLFLGLFGVVYDLTQRHSQPLSP